MRKLGYALLVVWLLAISACTFHFPPDWDWDYSEYRVILKVDPDDAQVLLNGKWIGDAYEFSTWNSAIVLSSRNNELVIKKDGFIEESIDLFEYKTQKITIRLKLLKDKDYTGKTEPGKSTEKKPLPQPKTVPTKEIPQETPEESPSTKFMDVTLEVYPYEASIYLNGKFWGISPKDGKIENFRLKAGENYILEVIKPGYQYFKKEIVATKEKSSFKIRLMEKK